MKGTVKIISILLIAIMLVSISTSCFATTVINRIGTGTEVTQISGVENMAKMIIGIIRYVAAIAGVILVAVFGIKFMLGSAEEKADYKKSFIPLIVGVVVVFGATWIAELIFQVANAG